MRLRLQQLLRGLRVQIGDGHFDVDEFFQIFFGIGFLVRLAVARGDARCHMFHRHAQHYKALAHAGQIVHQLKHLAHRGAIAAIEVVYEQHQALVQRLSQTAKFVAEAFDGANGFLAFDRTLHGQHAF